MKTKLVLLALAATLTVVFAAPVYGRSPVDYPGTQNVVRLQLFDPDFTQYYGAPLFYSPFGYYSYGPYLNSPPPVWIPPPPMTLFTHVVTRWVDPQTLRVTWTGDTNRTKRLTVALLDKSRRLLLVNPTGISLTPYIVTVRVPSTASYVGVTTFDALGRETVDITVPLPPR